MKQHLARLWQSIHPGTACVLGGITLALLWAYWPTLGELVHRWTTDTQYSHGYLVPGFAGAMLWLGREKLVGVTPGLRWGALLFFLLGGAFRFAGAYLYFDWLDAFSLLPCLAGMAVLLGGKQGLRWAWPAIAFLVFMIPLPFRLETALAGPLQRLATVASTYTLQTLGFPALDEGNVILLNDTRIGVVEACSGLSMLVIFFALSTAVAFVIERPRWEKYLVVLSAVPIALIANVIRIVVTGMLHELVSSEVANYVFHDVAGWLMMPLALGLLWVELKLLGRLLLVRELPTTADCSPIKRAVSASPKPAAEKKPRSQRAAADKRVSPLSLNRRTKG